VIRPAIALTLLAALALAAGCSGQGPASESPTKVSSAAVAKSGCADVTAPKPRQDGGATEPRAALDATKTNTVTFTTSCGAFTVTLDVKRAPKTTASVAALAHSGFYNQTIFHRIVPGFVIQGGDPTATGSGGPGYQTVDKPSSNAAYTRGVVAMAKTGSEAPGTSGSQFFVVTAADAGLPPDYAIVGTVTKGMDTVKRIEAIGTASEKPSRPVVITKATFSAR
jgi:cyclophilin family peptidyl-prolyl cis-trans isomerase